MIPVARLEQLTGLHKAKLEGEIKGKRRGTRIESSRNLRAAMARSSILAAVERAIVRCPLLALEQDKRHCWCCWEVPGGGGAPRPLIPKDSR